ncbi:hypothetical protein [Methylobacterium sp. Leaf118]|uniref:hypothetical protein n=1 Tax=Methylobacterium sp. Leaf118 TaxID=2876562 RepID=UPI001E352DC8|nr:hypothetical protein [Methylobacterium sp. Leaf118]
MIPFRRTLIPALAFLGGLAAAPAIAADAGTPGIGRRLCPQPVRCRRPPGPPDRDVRPFEGSVQGALGRPCGFRWRYTPSGPRRVRVCF